MSRLRLKRAGRAGNARRLRRLRLVFSRTARLARRRLGLVRINAGVAVLACCAARALRLAGLVLVRARAARATRAVLARLRHSRTKFARGAVCARRRIRLRRAGAVRPRGARLAIVLAAVGLTGLILIRSGGAVLAVTAGNLGVCAAELARGAQLATRFAMIRFILIPPLRARAAGARGRLGIGRNELARTALRLRGARRLAYLIAVRVVAAIRAVALARFCVVGVAVLARGAARAAGRAAGGIKALRTRRARVRGAGARVGVVFTRRARFARSLARAILKLPVRAICARGGAAAALGNRPGRASGARGTRARRLPRAGGKLAAQTIFARNRGNDGHCRRVAGVRAQARNRRAAAGGCCAGDVMMVHVPLVAVPRCGALGHGRFARQRVVVEEHGLKPDGVVGNGSIGIGINHDAFADSICI